jgi:PII-like signaling protein
MYCLTIRIKKNDNTDGKRTHHVILDLLKKSQITGATVWTGIGGYGKHGTSDLHIEGITVNMPLIIEIVDDKSKIESVLPEIKKIVDGNGLVTIHEVDCL